MLRQFTLNKPTQIDASDVQWLVSYADAPQMLLPMPTGTMICDDELDSEGRAIRFRGSSDWAPPRKQWIFTVRPFIHR
ncbi:unnamed protein product [Anisakis simplex]|uniref:Rubicon PI3K-binding domain-containing protein n=1 Tax=Anisakis simplex TaxID=6269 RepID=A0A3P6PAY2_ANISI|nr:unnamed protein product [Anisakis simplex]